MSRDKINMIKNLILSGGAFRCCSHIGCVRYLEEKGSMQSIDTFIGTSAGAIVACLLCMGFKSSEMEEAIWELIGMQSECPPDIENILNIYYSMGLSDGELVRMFIRKMLKKKVKRETVEKEGMTFLEFAKYTGKNLVVLACKLPDLEKVYFSVDNYPDLDIVTAIRASCSLPFIFTPITIQGDVFIDAGIINNFPHDYVKNNKLKDTLGIHIRGASMPVVPDKLNLLSLIRTILDAMMRKLNTSYGDIPASVTVVEIHQENTDGFDIHFDMSSCAFKINKEKVGELIELGYGKIKAVFELDSTSSGVDVDVAIIQ